MRSSMFRSAVGVLFTTTVIVAKHISIFLKPCFEADPLSGAVTALIFGKNGRLKKKSQIVSYFTIIPLITKCCFFVSFFVCLFFVMPIKLSEFN